MPRELEMCPPPAEPTGGWIEWKGKECSLPDGLEIDVKYGDGRIYRTSHPDGVAGWAWAVRDILAWARIIAYRIVKPAEPSTTHLGHTDLMVSPEAIEEVLTAEPSAPVTEDE